VAASLVVGIYPASDAKALEDALSQQHVDVSKVKVVSPGATNTEYSGLEFVDVINEMESNSLADEMTKGLGVLDDASGTGVPGIQDKGETYTDPFPHHEAPSRQYFAAFAIPDDEVNNFAEAVADGRAVVIYPDAGPDAQAIAAALKEAGLRNVRAY
jgi:rhodanese-related sulfurtransferase